MPPGIGKRAERILEGCLERAPDDRWTIGMVDSVAWAVGAGDSGDDESDEAVSSPTQLLPPPARSRSRSRPTSIPEHAVADDSDAGMSPVMDARSASRSRTSGQQQQQRSRSRLCAFHPYQHDQHFPAQHQQQHDGSGSEPSLHSSSLRSVSPPSSSSAWFSSIEFSHSSSSSGDRGRGDRDRATRAHHPSASRSRSPSAAPLTPVEVAAVLASRGRKASRATALPSTPDITDDAPLLERWTSPDGGVPAEPYQPLSTRSASRDARKRTRANVRRSSADVTVSGRAESVPPHSLWSLPWSAQSFQGGGGRAARTTAPTPVTSAQGKAAALRSRSVCRP